MRRRGVKMAVTAGVALAVATAGGAELLRRGLFRALTYFPSRVLEGTPADAGLRFEELLIETRDGERLHGWWIPACSAEPVADLLFLHGNGGNISHRLHHARLLCEVGFSVLLVDYRGYGRSSGRTDEAGTYADARAAATVLAARSEPVGGRRRVYLGESLGGAVAVALALEVPPDGLVLQSSFTGIREMARVHYPLIPGFLVPDAYPSRRRIAELSCPLLIAHGARDEIVPFSHAEALLAAAPGPKRLLRIDGAGHNDLISRAGAGYARALADWARGL